MAKPTRRQRKQLRDKRPRARGVAAPALPSERALASRDELAPIVVAAPSQPTSGKALLGWWSSWPLSIKLLVLGILVLIALGLYRRYSEDRAGRQGWVLPDPSGAATSPETALAESKKVQADPAGPP